MIVVWRIVNKSQKSKKKSQVVTNIKEFNKIAITNSYSISIQSNIIAYIRDCNYINLINKLIFFFQFLIIVTNKHKFSLITYRNKKKLQVIAINFKNSPIYIQQIINKQLQDFRKFVRIYINDIAIFFKTFVKYINYLNQIFTKFVELRIILSSKKIFLNYLSIILLRQKIDAFELFTIEERITIVKIIKFSKTLKTLKIYLGLVNYQQDKIV